MNNALIRQERVCNFCLKIFTSTFIIAVSVLFSVLSASAEGRIALLIGNSKYDRPEMSLKNPFNDVFALDKTLSDLDFLVRKVIDGNRKEMLAGLSWMTDAAQDADMAMVFFAGHGVQVRGENYLVGRDLRDLSFDALETASISLSEVRRELLASDVKLGMIVLDACRNNPLSDAGVGETGLASVRGGAGLLVAYATDPGNVAYDGDGENSVFTEGLLKNLKTPGLDIRLMFGRVRQNVVRETYGRQIPWVEESVLGEHYLLPHQEDAGKFDEIMAWRQATFLGTQEAFEQYIQDYPGGLFQTFAEERKAQIESVSSMDRSTASASIKLSDQDLAAVQAALGLLGYTSQERGLVTSTDLVADDLSEAFESWRLSQPKSENTDQDALLRNAAQLAMFLAATTAQRIRTDLVIHSSIGTHFELAGSDVDRIRELARTSPEAKALLPEAEADLTAIQEQQERVAQRLDASLAYYQRLLDSSSEHFRLYTDQNLFWQDNGATRSGGVEPNLFKDASKFVDHVRAASSRAPGSYAWFADFI